MKSDAISRGIEEEISLMSIYITHGHMTKLGGGKRRTVLARAKMLGEQGFKVTILTVDNFQNYSAISRHLRLNRQLNRNVKLVNMCDYYRSQKRTVYQKGLRQGRHFKQGKEISLIDEDGSQLIFARPKDLITYWLEEILSDGDVVISEVRYFDYSLFDLETKVKKIYQLHTSHYSANSTMDSSGKLKFSQPILPTLKRQHGKDDCVLVLTKWQKCEILKAFPHLKKNLVYLPHSVPAKKIKYRVDDKQICIASRLSPGKNLVDALKAFSIFREENPGYRLVICGQGKSRKELEEKIAEMNLCDDVTLMGFVKNVDRVFQESKFSLQSSYYEGFGMSVLESIANGCPVVSYNIRYGPNEIITEESGILTSSNNPYELAKAMSAEAVKVRDRRVVQKSAERYSVEMNKKKWLKLVSD